MNEFQIMNVCAIALCHLKKGKFPSGIA